jgi:hypothetical protein
MSVQSGDKVKVVSRYFADKRPHMGEVTAVNNFGQATVDVSFYPPVPASEEYTAMKDRQYYGRNTDGQDFTEITSEIFPISAVRKQVGGRRSRYRKARRSKARKTRRS